MDDKPLEQKLQIHAETGAYPLHTPGHKRNAALLGGDLPYALDVTEISGFDDLHNMRGVLADVAALGAKLYGADCAFPLVNGSTAGILAAIRAVAKPDSAIIYSAYSHRSVKNAAELCGLKSVTFTPPLDSTSGAIGSTPPDMITRLLDEHSNVRAVVLTSPTYEGAVSDVAAVAEIAHARNVPLIVDAAHGAHFVADMFPRNAVRSGADVEIVSLHKTLPSLTQTSLLLLRGERVGADAVRRELRVFQTSSPSYILLASIDRCLRLIKSRGTELFAAFSATLDRVEQRLRGLRYLRRVDASDAFFAYDRSKFLISTLHSNITGTELASRLRKRGFEVETSSETHILALTTVADDADALLRFADVLCAIDAELLPKTKTPGVIISPGVDIG